MLIMKISNKTKQQKIGEEEEEINKVYAVRYGEEQSSDGPRNNKRYVMGVPI